MPAPQSPITTHVLDTARGLPARAVPVTLEYLAEGKRPRVLGRGLTDDDGRLSGLLRPSHVLELGLYRLSFATDTYFQGSGQPVFFPIVQITFIVSGPARHYHVPLLLSPYGYSTYRGS